MDVRVIDDKISKEAFNASAVHPLQAWQWGEARKSLGTQVVRIGEFNGDRLMDAYQLTIHPIPHTPLKVGYLPRSRFPSKSFLQFLMSWSKEKNVIFVKLEPKESAETTYPLDGFPIVKSPHQLFPDWTMVLDLSKTEEELLAGMKQKTRYNIRLAEKKGVTVTEESDDKGFDTFIKLYMDTTKRQGYFGHNEHYHRSVWNAMKDGIAHILVARYEGVPVAAYELFLFNNTFYYPYGGSSVEHRNVMGANLLMWEAIKMGKRLGATTFDMWGSSPPNYDENDSYAGFTRFKEGYGAQFYQTIGSYDLVVNNTAYQLYNHLNKTRWTVLNFLSRFRS